MGNNKVFGVELTENIPETPFVSRVFERADGEGFIAYHQTPGGSSCEGAKTRSEAFSKLCATNEFHNKFWRDKINWSLNGDRTEDGAHCLRINGVHFTAVPNAEGHGFGGRKFVWREHKSGEVYWSCDVWHQGTIPPEFRPLLTDNAEWLENTSAVG